MSGHSADTQPRSMLWFASDLPNLCSLVGLASAGLAVYFAAVGLFSAAMVGLIWAVVFDWLDGRIARGMSGRTAEQKAFGAQFDSLIDMVSFAVVPAVLLLSVGHFDPRFLPGAFVCLAADAIRLSYFNVFGLAEGSVYRGLALDNNALILVALFALRPLLGSAIFAAILYTVLLILAALNVAPIRTPKLSGNWYYAIVGYATVATAFYSWQMFRGVI